MRDLPHPLATKLVALLSVEAKPRRRAVEAFSREELGDEVVTDGLRRLLATDEDVAVRAAAAEALGRAPRGRRDGEGDAERDVAAEVEGNVERDIEVERDVEVENGVEVERGVKVGVARAPRLCPRVDHQLRAALLAGADDASPVVRDAAIRALARRRERGALAILCERAGGDLVWWVRRAALYALGVIAGTAPGSARTGASFASAAPLASAASPAPDPLVEQVIGVARAALADPFWRVRHAAVQVLSVLGRQEPERREEILADVEGGSADYLRSLWGPTLVEDPRAPKVASRLPEALADRDPAVVTARLAALPAPPALALVELLCDPHVPLRELAVRRLLELADPEAFAAALRWLDEPRIPHVATTVIEMLDGLGDPARALAEAVLLAPARPGASRWAIGWVVALADEELAAPAWRRAVELGEPELALPLAPEDFLVEVLRASATEAATEAAAAAPPSGRLALAVAEELLRRSAAAQRRILAQLPARQAPALASRLNAILPLELLEARVSGATLADGAACPVALARLAAAGRLSVACAERCWSAGPEARLAVLDVLPPAARHARFTAERDPWVRRALGRSLAAEVRRARRGPPGAEVLALPIARPLARQLAGDLDPLLRVEAATLLDPQLPDELAILLSLISDPAPVVQAALFEPLASLGEEALAAARASATPELAAALDQWLQAIAPDPTALAAPPREPGAADEPLAAAPSVSSGFRTARAAPPPVARRPVGRTGLTVAPLCISGAFDLSAGSLHAAVDAGADLFFWEPTYPALARFLRQRGLREATKVVTGSYHADAASIEQDVHRALRRLRRDSLEIFLLFWARSPARLDEEAYASLERLQRAGLVRAIGFSTHDRALAKAALDRSPWDVVMTRHSAAHPGLEDELLPHAVARGAAVLTFSALCYGRMVSGPGAPSPADCYRYSLSQPGVTACISAPRRHRELVENLEVLSAPLLDEARLAELRRHGEGVRLENQRFGSLIRQPPRDAAAAAMALLEAALPPEQAPPGAPAAAPTAVPPSAASLGRSLTARNPSRRLRRGRL